MGFTNTVRHATAPPPPPVALATGPTPETIAAQEAAAAEERYNSRRGKASTILTGSGGDVSVPNISRRILLGS